MLEKIVGNYASESPRGSSQRLPAFWRSLSQLLDRLLSRLVGSVSPDLTGLNEFSGSETESFEFVEFGPGLIEDWGQRVRVVPIREEGLVGRLRLGELALHGVGTGELKTRGNHHHVACNDAAMQTIFSNSATALSP